MKIYEVVIGNSLEDSEIKIEKFEKIIINKINKILN